MKKEIATAIIEKELDSFVDRTWTDLRSFIDLDAHTLTITGPDGINYQIEIQCFWDNLPEKEIRVIGSIDDGGLRAFFPLTKDRLIKAEQGA